MAGRTFVFGDIHGEREALLRVFDQLPEMTEEDRIVFLGDYVDRGPDSAGVIRFVRDGLPYLTPAAIIALKGNHEDGWMHVANAGWPEFLLPRGNGCLETMRSFTGARHGTPPSATEMEMMERAAFFPEDVLQWITDLPHYFEDDHGIYVHAGLAEMDGRFLHPSETPDAALLLWTRPFKFFVEYKGKLVVCGHTATEYLPIEFDCMTPEDSSDVWGTENVIVIDTGCGKGGFLTCLELPARIVYESRSPVSRRFI